MLQAGDIALGDRGFCSYAHLALLKLKGVFGVFRIHQKIKVEFRAGEHTTPSEVGRKRRLPRWLYRLGVTDQVVQWFKPKKGPNWTTADQYAALPESLVVRELRYPVGRPGFRTKEVTLVTTLLEADLYPLCKRPGLPGGRAWGDRKTAARAVTSSSRVLYFERRRSARR